MSCSGHLSLGQEAELVGDLYRQLGLTRESRCEAAARLSPRRRTECYNSFGLASVHASAGFEYKRPEKPARLQADCPSRPATSRPPMTNSCSCSAWPPDAPGLFGDAVHAGIAPVLDPVHGWVKKGDKVALRRTSWAPAHQSPRRAQLWTNFHCPLRPGREDQRRHRRSRCSRCWRPPIPATVADLCLRRQCPLSPTPAWSDNGSRDPRPPHQAHLPTVLRSPPQRQTSDYAASCIASDPQQLLRQLRPLHRSHRRFLPLDDCHKSWTTMALHHHRQFRIISHILL